MNPIGQSDLGHSPTPTIPLVYEADPFERMKKLMSADTVRKEIYDRTKRLIKEFQDTYNFDPDWVRVSFGLNQKAGPPVYVAPCTVCGLVFREMLEESDRVEVGISLLEDIKYQHDPEGSEKIAQKSLTGAGK